MVPIVDDFALPTAFSALPAGPERGNLCGNLVSEAGPLFCRLVIADTIEERALRRYGKQDEAHYGAVKGIRDSFLLGKTQS